MVLYYEKIKQILLTKIFEINILQLIGGILLFFIFVLSIIYIFKNQTIRNKASNFKGDPEETQDLLNEKYQHIKIPESLDYIDLFT